MLRYIVLALVALSSVASNPIENEISDDQELLFAIVVNRHGERAPDSTELSLSDRQELVLNLTYLEGPEGLTNMGKRRSYQMGKFFRQRYGAQGYKLLSNLYNYDEIAIRCTDKERTKMTAQVAMAALYPPEAEQQWDEGLGKVWQPVPYTSVPMSEDYLRFHSHCERYRVLMAEAEAQSWDEQFLPYRDLVPIIFENTGTNFTHPLWFGTLFDMFRSTVGLGLDIPEWAKPILPRLNEAARLSYGLYFNNDEMKKIGGGVLLNQFMEVAEDIISGKPVKHRLRIFSCHDFNIGAMMHVVNVRHNNSIPEYGAVFSLELYRSKITGAYSVMPVYLTQAGESTAKSLPIKGCESSSYCNFTRFKELTQHFLLPERDYYPICGIKTEL
ncbi:venom acid phosphatase Acph-1-like [Anticarsia gemmatalis]|uniref:venom acid phosphatase Acph-1-like n=1 Tax=Anticarsia gemmatalis TaxID=129554 RepID=UPI003F76C617